MVKSTTNAERLKRIKELLTFADKVQSLHLSNVFIYYVVIHNKMFEAYSVHKSTICCWWIDRDFKGQFKESYLALVSMKIGKTFRGTGPLKVSYC